MVERDLLQQNIMSLEIAKPTLPYSEIDRTREIQPIGRIKYIAFDKDETLLNSMRMWPEIASEEVSKRLGINKDYAYKFLKEHLGSPYPEQIEFLDMDPVTGKYRHKAKVRESVVSDIRVRCIDETKPFPFEEVPGILETLNREGYKMFISSNHPTHIIKKQMDEFDLTKYFAKDKDGEPIFIGPDLTPLSKGKGEPHFKVAADKLGIPYLQMKQALVYIADTPQEAQLAKDAGVNFIGRQGFTTPERHKFWDKRADWVVSDFLTLPSILRIL